MFKTKKCLNPKLDLYQARLAARSRILTFPQRGPEHKLNEYFKQNYHLTLVQVCLKI
jgi:hypothetical protein